MTYLEAEDHEELFVSHAYDEQMVDLGEVRLNYVSAGDPGLPALLLIPGQAESWWGYERVIALLSERFQVFAVDLRGQGRSTWTPGRYTLDNFGNDIVRFLDVVVGRPAVVSGLSSGGTVAAWLSAFAMPGQVVGAVLEDAPLFSSEANPSCGQSVRQGIGPLFSMWHKWLGDQWSIGDWEGMRQAMPAELPAPVAKALTGMVLVGSQTTDGPPQALKEYDPAWGAAFFSGAATASCDHAAMLSRVSVPVLFTHHFRQVDETTGTLLGAISDLQVRRVEQLVTGAGQQFTYVSLPQMPHSMHGHEPELFARTVTDWHASLCGSAG